MGGRGAGSGGGGATGGLNPSDIVSTQSLISASGKRTEINETLQVLKDISDQYGVTLSDVQLAKLKGGGLGVLGYYDSNGNLAINESYFKSEAMTKAYDRSVEQGYHPPRGSKTGIEAVTAHEMGHALTEKAGGSWGNLDATADKIIQNASKKAGYKDTASFVAKISGYAKEKSAEAVAEAFADVYCNGRKASKESKAVVNALKKELGGKK